MSCRRASIDVCECMLCFSLTPSDAASSVARRCCSLLRAQVGRSLAVDGCPGRQLCQCMPYCCCRRLAVGVKRDCGCSLGVDYATYMYYKWLGKHRWTRIYCKRYDIACYKLPLVAVVVVVGITVAAAADVGAVVPGMMVVFDCVVNLDE